MFGRRHIRSRGREALRKAALVVVILLAGGALAGGAARAERAAAPGPSTETRALPTPTDALTPLALAIRRGPVALDGDAVRMAIEDELQRFVVPVADEREIPPTTAGVVVDLQSVPGKLVVRYQEPGSEGLVRAVPTPSSPSATIKTIAWLVGNLARDQTSELLGSFTNPYAAAEEPASRETPPSVTEGVPPSTSAVAPSSPSPVAASVVAVAPPPVPDGGYAFVTAALFFPMATNALAPDIRTHLSLNLIYGRIGRLDRGLQVGPANVVAGDVDGAQIGILFNRADGELRGWQVAVGSNVTGQSLRGVQVAAISNSVGRDLDGLQIAFVNHVGANLRGAQVGVANLAGDVRGFQAGLVNRARNVRGVQLGLLNISDDIDGFPIGLINVSASGGVHPTVWTSGTLPLALGVKFSTRHIYTLFSGGADLDQGQRRLGPGLAFGFRVPTRHAVFESDLAGTYLFGGPLSGVSRRDGLHDDTALLSWRVLVGVQLYRHLTPFAGAALTTRLRFYQSPTADVSYELGPDFFAGVQL